MFCNLLLCSFNYYLKFLIVVLNFFKVKKPNKVIIKLQKIKLLKNLNNSNIENYKKKLVNLISTYKVKSIFTDASKGFEK